MREIRVDLMTDADHWRRECDLAEDEIERIFSDWRQVRAENERLSDALAGLAEAARRFSTEADYAVAEAVEEEFAAALDDAEALVRSNDALSESERLS